MHLTGAHNTTIWQPGRICQHKQSQRITSGRDVTCINAKKGYSYINRNDTCEVIFVHPTAITGNNPNKIKPSVGEGDTVEFVVVVEGKYVEGSRYVADKRPLRSDWILR